VKQRQVENSLPVEVNMSCSVCVAGVEGRGGLVGGFAHGRGSEQCGEMSRREVQATMWEQAALCVICLVAGE